MSGSTKVSISLPGDLVDRVRARSGARGLSAYVAQALDHRLAMDKLQEIVEEFEARNEPLTPEELDQARAQLRRSQIAGQFR